MNNNLEIARLAIESEIQRLLATDPNMCMGSNRIVDLIEAQRLLTTYQQVND